jgi:hypothetical protein
VRPIRLPSSRFAFLSGVAFAVLALAIMTAGLLSPRRAVYSGDSGPLRGATSRTWNSLAIPVGQVRTWAMVILDNPKGRNAVIDRFETRPPLRGGGMDLLGSYVANDPGRTNFGQGPLEGRASESLGRLVPVEGATVPQNDRGAALVFEVTINRPGLFWIEGVDVDFHIGKRKYTVKNDTGLVLCGPHPALAACPKFEDRPRQGCASLGYVPFGKNGCVPPS